MGAVSAGICLWRINDDDQLEVLIVHPGGPFWANKDEGAWSFPKGEFDPGVEAGLDAARREFAEELGHRAPQSGEAIELGETKLKSGKRILVWALQGDLDVDTVESNTFEMQWPPKSAKMQRFPEVDRALWCDPATATAKLNPAQAVFIERLADHLG